MADVDTAPVLRFHGSPRALEALVPQALFADGDAVSIALDRPREIRSALQVAPAGAGASWLQVSLPEDTPPGVYEGMVTCGERGYAAQLTVAEEVNLLLAPGYVKAKAAPKARVPVTFAVANTGNVVYEIRRNGALGLIEESGVDDAVGAALRHSRTGERRIERFADELAARHAGLVTLAVGKGRGRIEPGEVRDVEVTFRMPEGLKPGRVYSGHWSIANVQCRVEVEGVGS
jgi:hypothetical protein